MILQNFIEIHRMNHHRHRLAVMTTNYKHQEGATGRGNMGNTGNNLNITNNNKSETIDNDSTH